MALLFERHGPHVSLLQELGTSRVAVREALIREGVSVPELPLTSDPVHDGKGHAWLIAERGVPLRKLVEEILGAPT